MESENDSLECVHDIEKLLESWRVKKKYKNNFYANDYPNGDLE
jgi:hypothetical protein